MGRCLTRQQRQHYLQRIRIAFIANPTMTINEMLERFTGCTTKLVARARQESIVDSQSKRTSTTG